jgi:hypothetical protein
LDLLGDRSSGGCDRHVDRTSIRDAALKAAWSAPTAPGQRIVITPNEGVN